MTNLLIRKTKEILRKLFDSGLFIIWKLVGVFRLRKISVEENNWQNILVIQLNAIGDVMMSTPAIKSLRQRFPHARIDALVRPHTEELLCNNPKISKIYTLERLPRERNCLNFNTILNAIKTIGVLKKNHYDLSIDFSSQFSTAWISFLIGAKHRLGIKKEFKLGWFEIYGFDYLYTRELSIKSNLYQVDQNIELLKPLGCILVDYRLELFPGASDFDYVDKILKQAKISAKDIVVCIHPGAKWAPKRWPEENFGELIRRLSRSFCRVLLIGYGSEEVRVANEIIRYSKSTPIYLVDKLSLPQMAAIIKRSHLFIGNDSGPMHLAAAMGTPSVLFFGPVPPKISAPRGTKAVILYKNTECSPCTLYFTKDKCRWGDNICLNTITVDEVWEAACKQLPHLNVL